MYFPRWEKTRIHYILCPANDDAQVFDELLEDACSGYEYVHFLSPEGDRVEIDGFDFIGFNLVCDYPFGIKDRCRMDHNDFEFPPQRGIPAFTVKKGSGYGWKKIDDWFSVARGLPTLEDELEGLVRPRDMKRAVYIMHMPPAGVGLDVCQSGDRPACKSVFKFLEKEQPLLSLHGHIHESYRITSIWKTQIGSTWAVQPGQGGLYPVYVIIDTDTMSIKRYGHDAEFMMVKGYVENGEIKHVRMSELPDYLIRLFHDWNKNSPIKKSSGQGSEVFLDANAFLKFCSDQGVKIRLIKTEL